ncbi:MAG: hypothetical protein ABI554_06620 [Flavobacterium sp.]
MKKIILLFLLFSRISVIAQDSDANYAKTVQGEGIKRHSLAKTSKTVVHLFDAFPKITTYQYKGTKYAFTAAQQLQKRVFYPPHWSNHDQWQLTVPVPTYNDEGSMIVSFNDLDLMQAFYLKNLKKAQKENDEMMKKMSLPIVPITIIDNKKVFLESHKMFYANAQKVNSNYIAQEKGGIIPVKFPNIVDGFIRYSDYDGASFQGIVQNRYIINIELKEVKSIHNCTDAEQYLKNYISKINFSTLLSAPKAIIN